jgi:hypothetical protein
MFTGVQPNTFSITCFKAFDDDDVVAPVTPEDTIGDDGVVITLNSVNFHSNSLISLSFLLVNSSAVVTLLLISLNLPHTDYFSLISHDLPHTDYFF